VRNVAARSPRLPVARSANDGYTILNAAHMAINRAMYASLTYDPDKDFVMMMIPHHQGAVDMARVELKYGKDAELRALAENIISSQEKEIVQMKAWQDKIK